MKIRTGKSLVNLDQTLIGVVLILAFVCSGCGRKPATKPSGGPPPGRAAETWAFWEAFNKTAVAGTGIEALKSPAYQGEVDVKDTCAVLDEIIEGERARCRDITSLLVLNVDPELTAYAVEFVRSRTELADALQDYVILAKKQEAMTSAPVLGVGLLLNLLNHSDDKSDGILWSALLDQAKQTSKELQSLREPAMAVEAKAASVRHANGGLSTEEMRVRIKLAQTFGREFPPLDTYAKAAASAKARENSHLSDMQIMQTLIGRSIGEWYDSWKFDSLQEFVSFKTLSVTNRSEVLADYEVRTHVKGVHSGQEHNFNLRLTYGWLYTRWKLIELQQLQ